MVPAGLYKLCDPAFYYLLISLTIIIVIAIQNYNQGMVYCVGTQKCPTNNTPTIFIIKLLYVLVWTWILNVLCKNGYEPFSWILVLIPIVLMFVFMAFFISHQFDFGAVFQFPNIFN